MNDSPAPRRSLLPMVLGGLLGFFAGMVLASVVFGLLFAWQHRRHQAEMATVAVNVDAGGLLDSVSGAFGVSSESKPVTNSPNEEQQAMAFGKSFVGDLESNRLALAYRQMSTEFQQQTERAAFDEMIAKYPSLRRLDQYDYNRTYKVRKSADASKWEFYCTARDPYGTAGKNLVNFALIVRKTADGEWTVAELEIKSETE